MLASCQNQLISSRYLPSNAERWKPGSVPRTLPKASPSGPGSPSSPPTVWPNSRIAREVGVSRPTVMLWRQRFLQGGPSRVSAKWVYNTSALDVAPRSASSPYGRGLR